MEENGKRVSIDQLEMLDHATGFGLFCKAILDFLPASASGKEKECIPMLAASLMGRSLFGPDGFKALMIALADVAANRAILLGKKGEVRWPCWDPDDHFEEDCHPLCDAFFAYFSYYLYSQKKVSLPDDSLGAIFTLSGVALEGVARGYHLADENMKSLYPKYRGYVEKAFSEHGDPSLDIQSTLQALMTIVEVRAHPNLA